MNIIPDKCGVDHCIINRYIGIIKEMNTLQPLNTDLVQANEAAKALGATRYYDSHVNVGYPRSWHRVQRFYFSPLSLDDDLQEVGNYNYLVNTFMELQRLHPENLVEANILRLDKEAMSNGVMFSMEFIEC